MPKPKPTTFANPRDLPLPGIPSCPPELLPKSPPERLPQAPFSYFGGKRFAAPTVWAALGDPRYFVDPFGGSLAVMLNRPTPGRHNETVGDLDGLIVNFWRAVAASPNEVVQHALRPMSQVDLYAVHQELAPLRVGLRDKLRDDVNWFDARVAGLWLFGQCSWPSGGFCSETKTTGPRPHCKPQGILGHSADPHRWVRQLSQRLIGVRLLCLDWQETLGKGELAAWKEPIGVFLDPPYFGAGKGRDERCYSTDHATACREDLRGAIEDWCREHADLPHLRIVLAGWEGEYTLPGWRVVRWRDGHHPGWARDGADSLERLWLSPTCLGVPQHRP